MQLLTQYPGTSWTGSGPKARASKATTPGTSVDALQQTLVDDTKSRPIGGLGAKIAPSPLPSLVSSSEEESSSYEEDDSDDDMEEQLSNVSALQYQTLGCRNTILVSLLYVGSSKYSLSNLPRSFAKNNDLLIPSPPLAGMQPVSSGFQGFVQRVSRKSLKLYSNSKSSLWGYVIIFD
jgi:hypothetical protein